MPAGRTDAQLAWVAGLFEGEGTIRIGKPSGSNLGQLMVSLVNTDHAYIALLNEWWPGTVYSEDPAEVDLGNVRSEVDLGNVRCWRWERSSRKAAAFVADILPYMVSERIRDKALLAVEYQAEKHPVGRSPDPTYAERQVELQQQMVAVGQRGVQRLPPRWQLEVLGRRRVWQEKLKVELADEVRSLVAEAKSARIPISEIARLLGVDRSTLYRCYGAADGSGVA
jgi:hypothetical protein